MTEKETHEYIESLQSLGSHLGLDSVRELCRRLGNPQDTLRFVHIAGTNGKGSILAMVSETLAACGYRTGRYLSPTISDYRERFQINGRMIGKKPLCEYVERLKAVCEQMEAEGLAHPTPFEFETALAFLYFAEKKCDVVVLETGMGGATDATNIITTTMVAVLASIGMDHMQLLGSTLSEIAGVKAGIIKDNIHVVSAWQEPEAEEAVDRACKEHHAILHRAEKANAKITAASPNGMKFSYRNYKQLKLSLAGAYQLVNAATALEVLECLRADFGFHLPEAVIRTTFAQISWPGRFERIAQKPDFYIDGAHNEAAAKSLAQTIEFYFTNKKIIYIMGVLKDKAYRQIIEATYPYADSIITVKTPHNERAMDAYELATVVAEYHSRVTAADSLEEAVEMAYLMAEKDTIIVAFGSLSYLGELTSIVKNGKWTRRDSHGK
jgi:dihydrofolate synthase/folylpolyglutamate synthase